MTRSNAVDETAGPVVVVYTYPFHLLALKPLAVAGVILLLFVAAMVYARTDFSIETDEKEAQRRKAAALLKSLTESLKQVDSLFAAQRAAFESVSSSSVDDIKKHLKSFDAAIVASLDSLASKELANLYRERLKRVQEAQIARVKGTPSDSGDIERVDEKIRGVVVKLNEKFLLQ